MEIVALVLLGLSLSMDTLAVAVTLGICKKNIRPVHALKVGAFFAAFQALMPALGWFAGTRVIGLIRPFDHWIAFGLLALLGGRMIYEALHEKEMTPEEAEKTCSREDPTSSRHLILLALATSIDAMAAGISLAFSDASIVAAVLIIGLVTWLVATAGTLLGRHLGVLFQRNACLAGGAVLILLGVKIVLEHLLGS
ncbi:MAG TPA: hypothetical protein DD640_02965 [Clostridiales bacterium]|nr:hypothetical protein [Clostridiales bacterium]